MRRYLPFLVPAGIALLLEGCIVSQSVRLQSLDVTGPHNHPPVHLQTDSSWATVTISPRFDFTSGPAITGKVPDNQGLDTGGTVRWRFPDVAAGLDADIPVTRVMSISLGGNFADGLWGAHGGLGLRFWGKGIAGRVEVGMQWQSVSSRAVYVLTNEYTFSQGSDSLLQNRRLRQTSMNWYGAFTLNSHFEGFPLNVFAQVGFVRQSLLSVTLLKPVGEDAEYGSSSVILAPGLSFDLSPSARLVGGARLYFENRIQGAHTDPKVFPFIQVDFGL